MLCEAISTPLVGKEAKSPKVLVHIYIHTQNFPHICAYLCTEARPCLALSHMLNFPFQKISLEPLMLGIDGSLLS